jgi:hypothetical protein
MLGSSRDQGQAKGRNQMQEQTQALKAHFTEKQLETLRDFFTEEEIARFIEEKKPYPFEEG